MSIADLEADVAEVNCELLRMLNLQVDDLAACREVLIHPDNDWLKRAAASTGESEQDILRRVAAHIEYRSTRRFPSIMR